MRLFLLVFTVLSFAFSEILAADSLFSFERNEIPVECKMLSTDDADIGIEEILEPEWQRKFQAVSDFSKTSPETFYWLKIDFKGHDLSGAEEWSLSVGAYSEITLYFKTGDALGSRKTGLLVPDQSSTIGIKETIPFSRAELIGGRYLYVKLRNVQQFDPLPRHATYATLEAARLFDHMFSKDEIAYAIPTFLFVGGIVLMMLYSFGIFFLYRDKVFLHYSFYLFALVLYLGRKTMAFDYFASVPQSNYIFNEVIQVVVNIAYLSFGLSFLNARKDYPLLYRAGRYVIVFLLLIIIAELAILTTNIFSPIQIYLINFERYFMAVFALLGVIYIYVRLKNKLSLFIVVGSVCFTGGAVLGLILIDVRWMMAGATVEIFIFALGLGFRFQKIQKAKQKIEREIDQVKLTALKAQMNPHFIFNSLNSIRSYIIVNETRKASDYLIKFSKLIRLILQYTSSDYISLKEEISTLKLYVTLEQMRFREQFDFTMVADPDLDLEKLRIPPLIFQPYIENAIWHGLTPKVGEKTIRLTIEVADNTMVCTIRDNGIGRAEARKRKPEDPNRKSMALALTRERISLISQDSAKTTVRITDLVDGGEATGTEVKLILPLIIAA